MSGSWRRRLRPVLGLACCRPAVVAHDERRQPNDQRDEGSARGGAKEMRRQGPSDGKEGGRMSGLQERDVGGERLYLCPGRAGHNGMFCITQPFGGLL